jgi:KDO2-lipid IV(A) lauroyltransferase
LLDFLTYAAVMAVSRVLALLPLRFALFIGRSGGTFVWSVLRIRRRVVLTNIRHVLGDVRDESQQRAIAREAYRNFGMFLVEVLRSSVLDLGRQRQRGFAREDIGELDKLLDLKARRQPVIVCCPHNDNFDLGCYVFALEGMPVNIVMKPLESARFNHLMRSTRERYGHRMIMKEGDLMPELAGLLRAGEWVGLLPDQNAKARGVTVDFLGKPASIYKGAAVLHLDTGAPIVVVTGERSLDDPRRHFVRTAFLPPFAPTDDRAADVRKIMQSIATAMSDVILRRPEQYFWFHRLWGKKLAA